MDTENNQPTEVKQTQPKQPEQVTEVKQSQPTQKTSVTVNLTLADISTRAIALILDTILISLANAFLSIPLTLMLKNSNTGSLFLGLLTFAYFIGMEAYNNGQTVGKIAMKIKVVDLDGSAITPQQSIIRNLLRIVDGLPLFYIVGIIIASNSQLKQRFGDKIAKTVVIKK